MLENKITYEDLLIENTELKKRLSALEKDKNNPILLNKSERFLKSIFDNSPTAMIICEAPDGRITYINDAVWNFRGETDARMTNITVEEYVMSWKEFYPDGRQYKGEEMPLARSLINGEVVKNEQLIVKLEDGTEKWAAAWSTPIYNHKKDIIAALVLFYDITKQKETEIKVKESEYFFKESQRSASIGSYKTNFITDSWESSDVLNNIFGIDHSYQRNTLTWTNLIHPKDKEMMTKYLENEILSKHKPFNKEYRIIRKNDNDTRWVHAYGVLEFDANKKVVSLIGTIQDITERKTMENTIKENEKRLEHLNTTKDKFFSIISHDLRSPFNSILGLSNILQEDVKIKDYSSIETYAEIIHQSSQKAMDLLLNLIEWSKSQTKGIVFNPEFIELGKIINETVELMKYSAQQKSIDISLKLPNKANIFADKSMIKTIFRNLISNAIKFTKTGGEIIISIKVIQKKYQISISDNGIGIKKESLKKLFIIGENISTHGTQNESGTGLGLVLCKEFIEKHRGKIVAKSKIGLGSTFILILPKDNNY